MQTDSNAYTLGFATVAVVLVALVLSGMATGLKPIQEREAEKDAKFNILRSVMPDVKKENAMELFDKHITPIVVNGEGKTFDGLEPLKLQLRKEYKKGKAEQRLPLYVSDIGGKKSFIIPMHGNGLWDYIGGYLALKPDYNTIQGAVFTHVAETPGLGAEINKDWFQDNFKDEKLVNDKGDFVGVVVKKGKQETDAMHMVDGISGATITGDGVQIMIDKNLRCYTSYFKTAKN